MANPPLVIFGWVFTINDNNNENFTKLEPFNPFFEMSAAENDKKNRDFYNSASNFKDSQCLALNVRFWMWYV